MKTCFFANPHPAPLDSAMKRLRAKANWIMQILCALIAVTVGLCPSQSHAHEVTIGSGGQIARIPMDFASRSSIYQCLYYPQELGFASATIDSLSFYNNFYGTPLNRATKIWMGTTGFADLSGGMIPSGELSLVYNGEVDYPIGENTITIALQTPFEYTPGNLVLMVHRPLASHTSPGINHFYCQSETQLRARKHSVQYGFIDPADPPEGTLTTQFPQTTFYYRNSPVEVDLACIGMNGPEMPTAGELAHYQVNVINNGLVAQDAYTVMLFSSGETLITTLTGGAIQPLQIIVHSFAWIPPDEGPESLSAKVILPGDENTSNNHSEALNITVLPEGIHTVTVGNGVMINRMPVDLSHSTSLNQSLYYPGELGFVSGTITAVAYYNRFEGYRPGEPITIWMGSTLLSDLSTGWITSSDMVLVFDGLVDFPAGDNRVTIPLQTPFNHYFGNLVTLIHRPIDTQYSPQSNWFRCQRMTQNRTLMRSDNYTIDHTDPPFGNLLDIFPKTTFYHRELTIANDLAALSITGYPMPSVGVSAAYIVTVHNNSSVSQENYQVMLLREGVEIASVSGLPIGPSQSRQFAIEWIPDTSGATSLYGKVALVGDEVPENDLTAAFPLSVQAVGTVAVTVGDGGSTGHMPVSMYYRTSLFETIYLASELNIIGELASLQFYNDFPIDLPAKPTRIWLGETASSDLISGWIPSNQLTLVFDGNVHYPIGVNDILIPLATHYTYQGANLVMLVERPWDNNSYSGFSKFFTHNGQNINRSRLVFSDVSAFDTTSPPVMGNTAMYPKTTFIFITGYSNSDEDLLLPAMSSLGRAYPNPFHSDSGTRIAVSLRKGETGTLNIYNVAGRLVKRYTIQEGFHDIFWNGTDSRETRCASGIYLYRLDTPSSRKTGKLVLLK
ncbi:MAG: T9SS type A sorting domain-containing protein [Candidatus Cloacimonadaceae bacterium]|nr:T9SS type A sorting domain-containing protein [Candidatus Cloacimonadaceae bacterium]